MFHGLGVTYHIPSSNIALSQSPVRCTLSVASMFVTTCSSTLDWLVRGQFLDAGAGKGVPPPKFHFQSGVAPPIPAPRFTPPLPAPATIHLHLFPRLPCPAVLHHNHPRLDSSRLVSSAPGSWGPCLIGTSAFPGCLFLSLSVWRNTPHP
jgi:hypothetical protein